MNPPSERRFPPIPLAIADARASPGASFLRAKGPAPYQPRATPWVIRRKNALSPEGATQVPRRAMSRPYRAQWERDLKPRAMPWAGMARTVGAEMRRTVGAENPGADTSALEREIDQQVCALYALTPEEIKIVEDTTA